MVVEPAPDGNPQRLADELNKFARDRYAADRLLEDLDRAWDDHPEGTRIDFARAFVHGRGLELTASEWEDVRVWAGEEHS